MKYYISFSSDFGAKIFRSFMERGIITDFFSAFAIKGLQIRKTWSCIKCSKVISQILLFIFGDIFLDAYTSQPAWNLLWIWPCDVNHCFYQFRSKGHWEMHVFLSCSIYTFGLSEYQGTPCSKQAQYVKMKWLQWDSNPLSLSS